tara:strand:- start:161 stop:1729 length:1569 start_codon:yes stop_codon:yes gene_type:complete
MKIIKNYINKKIYKAYRKLKKNNQLLIFIKIKDEISDKSLTSRNINLYFLKNYKLNNEILVRQFLIRKLLGYTFNKILLFSMGTNTKFIYPLHYNWIKVLKKNDVKINVPMCFFLWYIFILFLFLKDLFFILKYILKNIFIKKKNTDTTNSIYFIKLNKKNLPLSSEDLNSKNIISWFIEKYKFSFQYKKIFHDYKVRDFNFKEKEIIYSHRIYKSKNNFNDSVSLYKHTMKYILNLILFLFKKEWFYLVFLKEFFLLKEFELSKGNQQSKAYLFHSSDWIFRPFWTYAAEAENIEIILYFYSVNYEKNIKISKSSWHLTNWPKLIVWDNYQKNFFENIITNQKTSIEIINPIWFEDNTSKLFNLNLPKNSIAIFTELPQKYSRYVTMGFPDNLYSAEKTINMIEDINDTFKNFNIFLIHKPKRNIGNLINKRYLNFIKSLKKIDKHIVVSSEINAVHIIKNCICTISQPFTSTALMSKYYKIPSIYYDTTGTLNKNHIAAHGIKIINTKDELYNWFNKLNK